MTVLTSWNLNAREFTPVLAASPSLRMDAPVFVPAKSSEKSFFSPIETLQHDLRELVNDAGIAGVQVRQLPSKFLAKFGRKLDLSQVPFSDLSTLVASIDELVLDGPQTPPSHIRTLAQAMALAGFLVEEARTEESDQEVAEERLVFGFECDGHQVGFDGDRIVRNRQFLNYVGDLAKFRKSIVQVVHNFCLKNTSAPPSKHGGLALSLFAAEWDRYHSVRHLASVDLKLLRERFGAVKLMPFLQAIPELDVVGTHPEVRVRIAPGVSIQTAVASPKQTVRWVPGTPSPDISTNDGNSFSGPHSGPRNISLSSELFGSSPKHAITSPASGSEGQTRIVLEQMLVQTQSQILALLSQVPTDPLQAATAVEKINQLQVLVNALKAALAVLPPAVVLGGKQKISLDSMLNLPPVSAPATPLAAAAGAGLNVGPLLADLSRILFAQVVQQQQKSVAPRTVTETNKALERTLAEIVSAASSPPCTPPASPLNVSSIGSGRLIIPRSLPTSPIPMLSSTQSTPLTTLNLSSALGLVDNSGDSMEQLLRGLMSAPPPGLVTAPVQRSVPPPVRQAASTTNLKARVYDKQLLLSVRKQMTDLATVPQELVGLSCKQAAVRVRA